MLHIFPYVCFCLLGLVFGSFFNVVGIRVPQQNFLEQSRSICPHCRHVLRWYELIPVVSYLLQFAKCRHCQQLISPIYPLIELSTAFLFMLSYHFFGLSTACLLSLFFVSLLMIVIITDIRYLLIPDRLLLCFTPLLLFMRLLETPTPWYDIIWGSLLGFVLLLLIILLSRGGMGAGDMKLMAVIGIVIGWKGVLLTLSIASLLGLVLGYGLIALRLIHHKRPIPFAPFLAIAGLVAWFSGEPIIAYYLSFYP
nr:A24 family peptidase [Gracilibacillus phocaeensis]